MQPQSQASPPPPRFALATTCSTATTLWLLLMLCSSQLTWFTQAAAEGPSESSTSAHMEQVAGQKNASSLIEEIVGSQQQMIDMKLPLYLRVLATLVSVVIFTVGVCGNLLVPLVVIKTKYLRNSTNLFLINLSVADLLVLTVCMPTVLVELHSRPETWSLGEPMCKLSNYVEMLAANGSIFTILAISFERYYAICEPLKAGYKCTRLRATIIICLIWLLSSLLTSPILLMAKSSETIYIDGSLVNNCILETDSYWNKMYVFVSMIAFFCLPLLVLVLVYWLIGRRLTRENLAMSTNTSLATSPNTSSYTNHSNFQQASTIGPQLSLAAKTGSGRLRAHNLFTSFHYKRSASANSRRMDVRPEVVGPRNTNTVGGEGRNKSFTWASRWAGETGSWPVEHQQTSTAKLRLPANKALSLDNHLMEINRSTSQSTDSFRSGGSGGLIGGKECSLLDNHLSKCHQIEAHQQPRKEATIREEEEGEEQQQHEMLSKGGGGGSGTNGKQQSAASLLGRLVDSLLAHLTISRIKYCKNKSRSEQPNSNFAHHSSLKRCPISDLAASSTDATYCRHQPLLMLESSSSGTGCSINPEAASNIQQQQQQLHQAMSQVKAPKKHSRFNWVRGFSVSSSSASVQTNCTGLLLSEGPSNGWRTSQQEADKMLLGLSDGADNPGRVEGGCGKDAASAAVAYFESNGDNSAAAAGDSCLDSLPGSSSTCSSSHSCSPEPMSCELLFSSTPAHHQLHSSDSRMLKGQHQQSDTSTRSTTIHGASHTQHEATTPRGGIWELKKLSEEEEEDRRGVGGEKEFTQITDYCDTTPTQPATTSSDLAFHENTTLKLEKRLEQQLPASTTTTTTRKQEHPRLMELRHGVKSVDMASSSHLYSNSIGARSCTRAANNNNNKRISQPSVQVQYGSGVAPQLSEFLVMQNLSSKKQQMDSRRQVVMMLAFVVTCFFLLFLPYRVFTLWLILSTEEQVQSLGMETYYNLTYFSRILIYLHSAINPIVYNLISTKFRRAFTSLLLCQGSNSRRKFTKYANYATNHKNFAINDNPKCNNPTFVCHHN